jgi:hypothetical protein
MSQLRIHLTRIRDPPAVIATKSTKSRALAGSGAVAL